MENKIKQMPLGQIPVTDLPDSERQPCEIWSRVMGYFRPFSEFNKGKKAEFRERKPFTEAKCTKSKVSSDPQNKLQDYEQTLICIAQRDMYIIEQTGWDYGDTHYERRLNPQNQAKDILKKYGVEV